MKICQVGTGTQPIGFNSKTAVEIVINNLSLEQVKLGNEVSIIDVPAEEIKRSPKLKYYFVSLPFPFSKFVPKPETLLHALKKFAFSIKCIPFLYKLNKKEKFDVIHLQNQYPGFFTLLFLKPFIKGPKFVYTSHTSYWTLPDEEFKPYYFKTLLERIAMKRADKVITVGEYQREQILHRVSLNPKNVMAIKNGVDLASFHPGKSKLNLKKKNEVLILAVAKIEERKNQFSVIKAIPEIIKTNKNVKFVFLGQPEGKDYLAKIQEYVKKNALEKHVQFLGAVQNNLTPEYYRAADIFVSASVGEGLPLTVLEAMASGLPVVLSNIGPHREFSKDIPLFSTHNSGEIAEKLNQLIANKKKRVSLGKLLAEKAKKEFSWKTAAEKNLEFYKK